MKKTVMLFVSTVLALSLVLAACSSGNQNNQSSQSNESNESASPQPAGSGQQTNTPAQPLDMKVMAYQHAQVQGYKTNWFSMHLEEKFNLRFEWDIGTSHERKQLIMASGDYPDVFIEAFFTKEEVLRYGQEGVLIPLNDLIDQHAPNVRKAIDEIETYKETVTTPDGNIYAIPNVNQCYHCTMSWKMWINTQWLDALGLDVPTTTEEYYDVLVAFRDRDPNGNGQKDEIPLTGGASWQGYPDQFLMNAFIYNGDNNLLVENGKVDINANKEGYRKGLQFMNRLYTEKLMDSTAFTADGAALTALTQREGDNLVGSAPNGSFGLLWGQSDGTPRHKEYDVLPPLMGPDGVQFSYWSPGIGNSAFGFAITNKATEEQQIAAIKMLDYFYTFEGTNHMTLGPEGKWWRPATAEEKDLHGRPARIWQDESLWSPGTIVNDNWIFTGPYFFSRDYRETIAAPQDPYADGGVELRLFQATQQYDPYKPDLSMLYPNTAWFDPNAAQEMAQLRSAITSHINQSKVEFITGVKNFDSDWDNYVAAFDGLGLKRYLEVLQSALD